ncbi:Mu DNA-binding domain-containing protein [Rhizobium sp. RU35A]|uniref:DDE-type integrase/transposase/recombinase n=1 Tax=Rhizobium sp. RU35A TaxID=1907414 RepID=UPI000955E566|nr:DDE-type integrase/transposase/recombinase [Rhizobium sp. RU35A]SIP89098.1 Mu DNA-binding domain-containing protein [Rhizobium sp. RU35A]
MKEWLTAEEIAAEALPDVPNTKRGVNLLADRSAWDSNPAYARPRRGRGGGMEYHYRILPTLAQVAHVQRYMVVGQPDTADEPVASAPVISGKAGVERDARLAVIAAFETFSRGLNLNKQGAVQIFCDRYQMGFIKVEDWVKETIPKVSRRTLWRWLSIKRLGKTDALAVDRSKARAGSGILETANGGNVRLRILGLIATQPHLSADAVRTQIRADFGDTLNVVSKGLSCIVPMPKIRTFQLYLKELKETHKTELLKLTNPDKFRSTMLPAGRGMYSDITAPNALWQIDASPVDALCTDGRHSVYVCIDIATRRMVTYISKTPRAAAVGLLIRKAILAWGTPQVIKTDNGSDFVAKETQRLFTALGIEADPSDAYSPAQKGHVERAIKTWQHSFVTLLPGYVGHSVSDRKAIEDRKSFADRLGQDTADAFNVQYTAAEFQERSDRWCEDVYQHREHEGLNRRTPFQVAAASAQAIRTVDERALDVLLMPVARKNGQCHVTKFGIRIQHNYYRSAALDAGSVVFVRMDPNDAGRAHVFSVDQSEYLGEAICPELRGIHPQTFEKARKEMNAQLMKERVDPIKAEIKKITSGPSLIDKALQVAARDLPNVIPLPKREEQHTTPQIAAALDVRSPSDLPAVFAEADQRRDQIHAEILAELTPQASGQNVTPIRTAATPAQKFRRWLDFNRRRLAGAIVTEEEAYWAGHYEQSAEFKAQKAMHDDFGIEPGETAPGRP